MALIVQRETLDALEGEWRELLPRCSYAPVFLSPTWLRMWWDEFGEGRELVLLAARREGALVGILPLMREGSRLSFAGDTKVCDYMDAIAEKGSEAEVLTACLQAVSEEPWDDITFWAVRQDSETLACLDDGCSAAGVKSERSEEDTCPQMALPSDWETYLESLGKKDRHELRRKLRKLPQGGVVGLEVLETPEDIAAATDEFLWQMRESRTDKAEFMTEQMERFFRRIVGALAGEGLAEMVFLTLDGKRVASVLCFRTDDEVLLYNSGYDPAYSGLSVGLLSKALALQRAIEQGKKKFDFLRGHEHYKYDLGAQDFAVYRCVITRG